MTKLKLLYARTISLGDDPLVNNALMFHKIMCFAGSPFSIDRTGLNKFDFEYDSEKLKIFNSYLRSKNISFDNETSITFIPFLDIKTNFKIEEFNKEILQKINFSKLMEHKNII